MNKIFNNPKINIYGSQGMLNNYIFMKRNNIYDKTYYIFHIEQITNEKFPIIYKCNRGYELIIYKDKKNNSTNKLEQIELTNNDILYNISIDEFLAIFKVFVECDGNKLKINNDFFEY